MPVILQRVISTVEPWLLWASLIWAIGVTLAAYAADGACCDLRDAEGRHLIKLYVALPKDRIGKNIF